MRPLVIAAFVLALFVAVPVVVLGQVVTDPADPGFLDALVKAVTTGQWRIVAILIAVAVVYGLRQGATRLFSGAIGAFFKTKRGGAVLALLGGIVTSLASLIPSSGPVTLGVVLNGFVLGVAAAGGWNVLKDLIWGEKPRPDFYPTP